MAQEQSQNQQQDNQQQAQNPGAVDALLGKLTQLLGREQTEDIDEDNPPQKVPYSRVVKEIAKTRVMREQMQAMQAELAQIKTAHTTEVAGVRKQLADHATQAELRRQEDVGFARAGLDEEGIDTIRSAWRRQPEATRGKTAAEWWSGQVEAHKAAQADPKKEAPKLHPTVAVLLPQVAKQEQKQAATEQRRGTPPRGEERQGGAQGPPKGASRKEIIEYHKKNR